MKPCVLNGSDAIKKRVCFWGKLIKAHGRLEKKKIDGPTLIDY